MNCHLMYRDRDFALDVDLGPNSSQVVNDLELSILCRSMAGSDEFLYEVSQKALLATLQTPNEILYRQQILRDCLGQPTVIKAMYDIAVEALASERRSWIWLFSKTPEGVMHRSIEVLQVFLDPLDRLRLVCEENEEGFESEGFKRFISTLRKQLEPGSLETIRKDLRSLKSLSRITATADLGHGNRIDYRWIHRPIEVRQTWLERLRRLLSKLKKGKTDEFVYEISERDESGLRALSETRGKAIAPIARDLERSANHVRAFFSSVRIELGFYVACMNLRDAMIQRGGWCCFPVPTDPRRKDLSAEDLYDVPLLLSSATPVIGNDLLADAKDVVLISGPNRGGKSTFLRAVGIAQLMMQAGLVVPARYMRAGICRHLFTHFKREEDSTMTHGKFEEELCRMSAIIDSLGTGDIVLLNESFASTNQQEGAEIGREVSEGLRRSGVKVFYVTHMTDLVQTLWSENRDCTLFLKANRLADGTRTFRLERAEPERTSHAVDLYDRIFAHGCIQ